MSSYTDHLNAVIDSLASAAKDLLETWDANEWIERADGGELAETVEALRAAVEASA